MSLMLSLIHIWNMGSASFDVNGRRISRSVSSRTVPLCFMREIPPYLVYYDKGIKSPAFCQEEKDAGAFIDRSGGRML